MRGRHGPRSGRIRCGLPDGTLGGLHPMSLRTSCDGNHTDSCDPDNCFRERMRYQRRTGAAARLQFRYGKDTFHGPTIRERQAHEVASAAAQGFEIRPKHPIYDRKSR